MGKRRIRCLKKLGYKDITAFDFRADRRKEAEEKYGVKTIADLGDVNWADLDALIVSTPPDKHDVYMELAIKNRKPAFIEASVVLGRLEKLDAAAKKARVLIAPSCTLRYHAAIKDITSIVKSGRYGKITNFTYHSGQYLPDWHPYEPVKNYYVSKKETGAAREIVPFELSWLVDLTGFPVKVAGLNGKTMDVGADIDDTYVIAMQFKNNVFGVLNVDVVSRYATRSLILNLEEGQILWRWDENVVKLYEAKKQRWVHYNYSTGQAAEGYNKNITEDMYVDELNDFIKAVNKKGRFPNTLAEDIAVLKVLEKAENFNAKK
jgi:predicted dehydrogenase